MIGDGGANKKTGSRAEGRRDRIRNLEYIRGTIQVSHLGDKETWDGLERKEEEDRATRQEVKKKPTENIRGYAERRKQLQYHKRHYYLHWVNNDGERRVIPLTAPLLSPRSGTFTSAMDGADSENAQDHHHDQETHTHHYDDGCCSRNHWNETQQWFCVTIKPSFSNYNPWKRPSPTAINWSLLQVQPEHDAASFSRPIVLQNY